VDKCIRDKGLWDVDGPYVPPIRTGQAQKQHFEGVMAAVFDYALSCKKGTLHRPKPQTGHTGRLGRQERRLNDYSSVFVE